MTCLSSTVAFAQAPATRPASVGNPDYAAVVEGKPIDSRDPEIIGGKPLFWASSVVSFDVQKDGSELRGISYDQLHEVVVSAFQRWVDAPCDDSHGPSIKLADFGIAKIASDESSITSCHARRSPSAVGCHPSLAGIGASEIPPSVRVTSPR